MKDEFSEFMIGGCRINYVSVKVQEVKIMQEDRQEKL